MLDFEIRPWGKWEEYLNEVGYRVKRIIVNPGRRISLQKHEKRCEHWVIVAGTGLLNLQDKEFMIQAGEAFSIAIGEIHRVTNNGNIPLIIIETQIGDCRENDIIRLQDDWNRV